MKEIPKDTGRGHRRFFRWIRWTGFYSDPLEPGSMWIRETGRVEFPCRARPSKITVEAALRPGKGHPAPIRGKIGLAIWAGGQELARRFPARDGPFTLKLSIPPVEAEEDLPVEFRLLGVAFSNAMAWFGRISAAWPLPSAWRAFFQSWRAQEKNRRLRVIRITADGETAFDFTRRDSPFNPAFGRKRPPGMNIIGFHQAELGVGESARLSVKAADAAGIPAAVVPLKVNCKHPPLNLTLVDRLTDNNPHAVNLIHIDPPQSRDIDHHHGPAFRRDKYNIGYWAWELPEFPDAWCPYFEYFDEIWAPSHFVQEAVGAKSPLPVLKMPHAISLTRPDGDVRSRFRLPTERFLFLFVFDLNSYAGRKNPEAVIKAYLRAFPANTPAGLVMKVHGIAGNEDEFRTLKGRLADRPDIYLISETLSRADLTALQYACDSFVSLHRAEGFGLALAESMFLGKPVIATDWSATTEYIDAECGCPVRCRVATLDRDHGPYSRGQQWADPDIDHAAEWMRTLAGDPDLARRLGGRARERIETRFAPEVIGRRYRTRLEAIAGW